MTVKEASIIILDYIYSTDKPLNRFTARIPAEIANRLQGNRHMFLAAWEKLKADGYVVSNPKNEHLWYITKEGERFLGSQGRSEITSEVKEPDVMSALNESTIQSNLSNIRANAFAEKMAKKANTTNWVQAGSSVAGFLIASIALTISIKSCNQSKDPKYATLPIHSQATTSAVQILQLNIVGSPLTNTDTSKLDTATNTTLK